jgi:hypothetical protein
MGFCGLNQDQFHLNHFQRKQCLNKFNPVDKEKLSGSRPFATRKLLERRAVIELGWAVLFGFRLKLVNFRWLRQD